MKRHKSPGKAHREGITVVQLMDMFPDETAARQWFEQMFAPIENLSITPPSFPTYVTTKAFQIAVPPAVSRI